MIIEKPMPVDPTSHAKRPHIVAILTNGGQRSAEVWYESEPGQRTLIANERVDNPTAAETAVNAHATRAEVPVQGVELVHR